MHKGGLELTVSYFPSQHFDCISQRYISPLEDWREQKLPQLLGFIFNRRAGRRVKTRQATLWLPPKCTLGAVVLQSEVARLEPFSCLLSDRHSSRLAEVNMAAAVSPGLGEHWWAELPRHVVLGRLREQVSEAGPETEQARPALPRDLMFGIGGELFLWDRERAAFCVLSLRHLGDDPDSLGRYQVGHFLSGSPGP